MGTNLWCEVSKRNSRFLFSHVSRNFEDFHTVEERCGDSVEVIGGTHEEHTGEIYRDIHAEANVSKRTAKVGEERTNDQENYYSAPDRASPTTHWQDLH
jgi:hypothetical protein